MIPSNTTLLKIILNQCHIKRQSLISVDAAREIFTVQSDVGNHLDTFIGKETSKQCDTFHFARVRVENSTASSSTGFDLHLSLFGPTSFGLIQFSNSDFHRARVVNDQ